MEENKEVEYTPDNDKSAVNDLIDELLTEKQKRAELERKFYKFVKDISKYIEAVK